MSRKASRHRLLRRRPLLLLSGAVASLAGYVALAVLAAHQQFFAIDYGTRAWVRIIQKEAEYLPWAVITQLGGTLGVLALIAAGMAFLTWRGLRRWALALPAIMAGAGALATIFKWSIQRARPDESPWGFPSGHTLSLVVFFGLMVWLVATASQQRRRWRLLACALCVLAVLLVAFSRLYLDRHWLSDVAGGLTLGLGFLLLVIWVIEVLTVDRTIIPARGAGPTEEP
ncbi:MAG TPA: phosphatase PAP2 family protein [Methylomirabilota bacterium]|jgi:undecaprenyl-diphosphatase|nr:phosphatase PAP2 family protein [Methylomirabilota bacterium]